MARWRRDRFFLRQPQLKRFGQKRLQPCAQRRRQRSHLPDNRRHGWFAQYPVCSFNLIRLLDEVSESVFVASREIVMDNK